MAKPIPGMLSKWLTQLARLFVLYNLVCKRMRIHSQAAGAGSLLFRNACMCFAADINL